MNEVPRSIFRASMEFIDRDNGLVLESRTVSDPNEGIALFLLTHGCDFEDDKALIVYRLLAYFAGSWLDSDYRPEEKDDVIKCLDGALSLLANFHDEDSTSATFPRKQLTDMRDAISRRD